MDELFINDLFTIMFTGYQIVIITWYKIFTYQLAKIQYMAILNMNHLSNVDMQYLI